MDSFFREDSLEGFLNNEIIHRRYHKGIPV